MSRLTGHVHHRLDRSTSKKGIYERDVEPVGLFGQEFGYDFDLAPTDVACPYCRELMLESVGPRQLRVKAVVEERIVVDYVPDTLRVLRCYPCRQVFTIHKDP